jgi:hypothetical protein
MYAAASTVSWVVVLARAARRRAKFFFSLLLHYTHTHIYMAARTPTCSIHSTTYALLFFPRFGYVCVDLARFFSISRRDPPRGAELFWTAVDQHRPTELSHIRSRHHYTRAPVATLKVIWFRFVCGKM